MLWIAKGKVVRKDFGSDLSEALRIYVLACKAEKSGATLRCKNMGFPPPEEYQREWTGWAVGSKGQRVEQYSEPLRDLNIQGIWWCPYCMKLRRFTKVKSFKVDGIRVPIPGMVCPMCRVSHRDSNVMKWNPLARQITDAGNDPNPRRARRNRRVARERRQ